MTTRLTTIPPVRAVHAAGAPRIFKIVAVCDGFTGGVFANEAVNSVKQVLWGRADVQSTVWRFDMLQQPGQCDTAFDAVSQAQMLIVAAFANDQLPGPIESWIELCLRARKGAAPVLVAVYPGEWDQRESPCRLSRFLRDEAARGKTQFLCNEFYDAWLDDNRAAELVERTGPAQTGAGGDELNYSAPARYRRVINA